MAEQQSTPCEHTHDKELCDICNLIPASKYYAERAKHSDLKSDYAQLQAAVKRLEGDRDTAWAKGYAQRGEDDSSETPEREQEPQNDYNELRGDG